MTDPLNRSNAPRVVRLFDVCFKRGVYDACELDDQFATKEFIDTHKMQCSFGILGDDVICDWQMFRYNPTLEANKLTIDSKAPTADYIDFIKSETRYARLAQSFPERAEKLFAKADATAKARYERLVKMGKLYE